MLDESLFDEWWIAGMLIHENIDYKKSFIEAQRELVFLKEKLGKYKKREQAILEIFPDTVFTYDSEGNFLDCHTNKESNLLLSKDEFIGRNLREVLPGHIGETALACISNTLKNGKQQSFEYSLIINNEIRFFETVMIKSSESEVLAIVKNVALYEREKDYLTGLFNRRYLEKYLIKIDHEEYLPVSMVMVDINGLKLINDAFGNLTGDLLLRRVSDVLLNICSQYGIITRIGGDEFVVVITNFSQQRTEKLVDAIINEIDKKKINNILPSISIGWETRNSMQESLRDIIRKVENHVFRKKLVDNQSMRHQIIKTIVETLNNKNRREKEHSEQVGILCGKIGKEMGYTNYLLKEIEIAGLLHDIGKITIREEILNKPGKLTKEEYNEVKKHPETGYKILKSIDEYSALADYILAHHERYDGEGYPRGVSGDNIPIVARIIAVADAYEAMISNRPYRKGITKALAIEEIRHNSGTQFDPKIVNIFISIIS